MSFSSDIMQSISNNEVLTQGKILQKALPIPSYRKNNAPQCTFPKDPTHCCNILIRVAFAKLLQRFVMRCKRYRRLRRASIIRGRSGNGRDIDKCKSRNGSLFVSFDNTDRHKRIFASPQSNSPIPTSIGPLNGRSGHGHNRIAQTLHFPGIRSPTQASNGTRHEQRMHGRIRLVMHRSRQCQSARVPLDG